jgi:dTDP-glucose 4,6-dehydratase
MKILITGGCGFIGSHVVRHFLRKYPQYHIINYDKLTYAGNPENLRDIEHLPNYTFVWGDVCNFEMLVGVLQGVDAVIHLAAESHVDNSVGDSLPFTMSNTYGTHSLLEAARVNNVRRFIHVSTDEVYGDIEEGSFKEDNRLEPNNPYAASKAAAEMIAKAHYKTYKMPIIITRGNNVFGPHQYPEKIIPRFVTDLLEGKKVPLHGDGSNIRTYIYTDDVCDAIDVIFSRGVVGETYNVGTRHEISNIELTRKILAEFGLAEDMIEFVADRPFNDKRYSIDYSKLAALGWEPRVGFEEGLARTIKWYKDNESWWKPLKTENARRYTESRLSKIPHRARKNVIASAR